MKYLKSKHLNIKNMYQCKYGEQESESGCGGSDSERSNRFECLSPRSITSLSQGGSKDRASISRKKALDAGRQWGTMGDRSNFRTTRGGRTLNPDTFLVSDSFNLTDSELNDQPPKEPFPARRN